MNKLTKASIATAAGIALLMGGAGTLAYWNESAGLTGGDVTTGHLELESVAAGTWSAEHNGASTPVPSYIVPGDEVTYTETLSLSARGDNLEFELDAELPSLASFSAVAVTTTFTLSDGSSTQTVTPGTAVTLDAGSYTVVVTVVVNFPWGTATPGDEDQDLSIDLGDIKVTATQI